MKRPPRIFLIAVLAFSADALCLELRAADSSDALIVLTTVGYLTGAGDGCKVVPKQSKQLRGSMALAIGRGNYGPPAQAHALLNNARQRGIADAGAGTVDCEKLGVSVQESVRSLLLKK